MPVNGHHQKDVVTSAGEDVDRRDPRALSVGL